LLPPAEGLCSIREQIQRIPRRGLGYELLLRNCADSERRRQLDAVFKGEIKLNYHGLLETPSVQNRNFQQVRESTGIAHNMEDTRDVLVYCKAVIVRGSLNLYWVYSENFHQHATIAQALRDLIRALPASPGENTWAQK